MVDIAALMKVLPVSSLEPYWVAILDGFIDNECIPLLEPPAGQGIPYIEPVKALQQLLRHQGKALEEAHALATAAVAQMRTDVADPYWVNFFDNFEPESPYCLPVSEFVAWLRSEKSHRADVRIATDILDFFDQSVKIAVDLPIFSGPDNWQTPWSLKTLPAQPTPKSMIQFMPGAPWNDFDGERWRDDKDLFGYWREAIRPVAAALEAELGEPVYYFADPECDTDDDSVHRFLVLHWCCSFQPQSAYVRYLLKVSGARNAEELKAALTDPANYTHPFEMNHAFLGLETRNICRTEYLPATRHKTVGVVFMTAAAREVAASLLLQQIGATALIVAPPELATEEWIKQASRNCRHWQAHNVYGRQLDRPMEILIQSDVLHIIANEPVEQDRWDLKLPDTVEDLLWLALTLNVEAHYYYVDRSCLGNPEVSLSRRGAPKRVAAQQAKRAAFTQSLTELRLDSEYGSSGLWHERGGNIPYDRLDLPLPLLRRIAAWQQDFDNTTTPPDRSDDLWWDLHEQEEIKIAQELQQVLGPDRPVKLYRYDDWVVPDEVMHMRNNTNPKK